MKAKKFAKEIVSIEMRPPTARKIINAARKHRVSDEMYELQYFLGAYVSIAKLEEFRSPEDRARRAIELREMAAL